MVSVEETRAMHTVDGKVIVITGAGKGVGKGMALHLGKGGARSSSPSGSPT